MSKITSVLLIDNNEIDNFINHKILENHGITNVISIKSASTALSYLLETNIRYELILIDIHLPIMDGFQFIDKFNELKLYKKQGQICLLTASLNPLYNKKAEEKNIKFIEKPLTMDKLFKNS